jgi:hypothetical protein
LKKPSSLHLDRQLEGINMNIVEMLHAIKNNEEAKEVFSDLIIELIKTDLNLKAAITEFLITDVSFNLDCSEFSDYYSNGYNLRLSIDGELVASDSFSTKSCNN